MPKGFFINRTVVVKYGIIVILTTMPLSTNAELPVVYDLVSVGDAGNTSDPTTGFGSVSYDYKIGTSPVTIEQYKDFLNSVAKTDDHFLYNSNMANVPNIAGISRSGNSGQYTYNVIINDGYSGNRPITFITWFSAARFANWMANGQPSGAQNNSTTEDGAYPLHGAIKGNTFPKNTTNPNTCNPTCLPPIYYLPSDDEWYKAAYYNGAGTYYLFATQSNTEPGNATGSALNQANYISNQTGYCTTQSFTTSISVNYLTDVRVFTESPSHYGTFDQTGNVWEWNTNNIHSQSYANLRGGAYTSTVPPYILASYYLSVVPNKSAANGGFRLAAPG